MQSFIPAPLGYILSWLPGVIPVHGPCFLQPHSQWIPQFITEYFYGVDTMTKAYCNRSDVIQVQINSTNDIQPMVKCLPSTMNIAIACKPSNVDKSLALFEPHRRDWCILHLNPLMSKRDIVQLYDCGFRQFQCNSLVLSLLPYSLEQVKYLKTNFQDVVVIGGGINSTDTLHSYQQVGVDHISLGHFWSNIWFIISWTFQQVLHYYWSI